jgi:hypothetical protein
VGLQDHGAAKGCCPMAAIGISHVELSGSSYIVLVYRLISKIFFH